MANFFAYENIGGDESPRSSESDLRSEVSELFDYQNEPEAPLRNDQVRAFSEVLPNAPESVTTERGYSFSEWRYFSDWLRDYTRFGETS